MKFVSILLLAFYATDKQLLKRLLVRGLFMSKNNCVVEITACYDIPDTRKIWEPWAHGEQSMYDDEFLKADTENEVALVAMTAVKNE